MNIKVLKPSGLLIPPQYHPKFIPLYMNGKIQKMFLQTFFLQRLRSYRGWEFHAETNIYISYYFSHN
jgi:hypothetical protein